MPTPSQPQTDLIYDMPTPESIRPWATSPQHHKYNSAFAPCLPHQTITDNVVWFETLGEVNKFKMLNQMFEELVHCANFYFAEDSRRWDRYSGKPKFVDNMGWLIMLYQSCSPSVTATHPMYERDEWITNLQLLTLMVSTDAGNLFEASAGLPAFLRGSQCLLKQRVGLYWHLYRFQLETRARRMLPAADYNRAIIRLRKDGQRHTLQWGVLEYVKQDYSLYAHSLGYARRSNDVLSICGLLQRDPTMTASQVRYLLGHRDVFFNNSCRIMNTATGSERLMGGLDIRYDTSDRLVFENPN